MTDTEVLELEMSQEVAGMTIRKYLRELLWTLWKEGLRFDSKRPFGTGGWKYYVYEALVKNGAIEGKLNEWGYVEEIDNGKADFLIKRLIRSIFDGEAK